MGLARNLTAWTRRLRPTGSPRGLVATPEAPPAWFTRYAEFMDGELQRLEASHRDLVAAMKDIDTRSGR